MCECDSGRETGSGFHMDMPLVSVSSTDPQLEGGVSGRGEWGLGWRLLLTSLTHSHFLFMKIPFLFSQQCFHFFLSKFTVLFPRSTISRFLLCLSFLFCFFPSFLLSMPPFIPSPVFPSFSPHRSLPHFSSF